MRSLIFQLLVNLLICLAEKPTTNPDKSKSSSEEASPSPSSVSPKAPEISSDEPTVTPESPDPVTTLATSQGSTKPANECVRSCTHPYNSKNRSLLYLAKRRADRLNYGFVMVKNCEISVKYDANSPAISIKTESDLSKIVEVSGSTASSGGSESTTDAATTSQ